MIIPPPITHQQTVHAVLEAAARRQKGDTVTGWPDTVLMEQTGHNRHVCMRAISSAYTHGYLSATGRCMHLMRHARVTLQGRQLIEDDHK